MRLARVAAAALVLATAASAQVAASAVKDVYRLYVAAESADVVQRVVFDGKEAKVEKSISVGIWPTEIEGPHGVCVSPDGAHWFVSMAHGTPFGKLYKYDVATDSLQGQTELGLFPATMQISPATGLLYCVNFNLHGKMLPSTVSVVDPEAMVEVAKIETGPMPHGSRVSTDGLTHYSCAMMSGHLFEIDAASFAVKRRLQVGDEPPVGHASTAKPTWVQPHPKRREAFVALNGSAQIAVIDLDTWTVARRFTTEKGPYNLDLTPDGREIIVTCKTAACVQILDAVDGRVRATIPTLKKVAHAVVVSCDGLYAFVTAEGIGGEPAALDVIDIARGERVATAALELQAGGIALVQQPSAAAKSPR